MYFTSILILHSLICIVLIGLVLLQQGKGADAGATISGGGGNTVFGAAGAADFLTKLTTGLAISFMVTSVLLIRSYQQGGSASLQSGEVDIMRGSIMSDVSDQVSGETANKETASKNEGSEKNAAASASQESTSSSSKAASNTQGNGELSKNAIAKTTGAKGSSGAVEVTAVAPDGGKVVAGAEAKKVIVEGGEGATKTIVESIPDQVDGIVDGVAGDVQ